MLWRRAAGWSQRKIVVALINQKNGAVWLRLPVLGVNLFPALQLPALDGFNAPVVAYRAALFDRSFSNPLESIEGLACTVRTRDEVQHFYLPTQRLKVSPVRPSNSSFTAMALVTMLMH